MRLNTQKDPVCAQIFLDSVERMMQTSDCDPHPKKRKRGGRKIKKNKTKIDKMMSALATPRPKLKSTKALAHSDKRGRRSSVMPELNLGKVADAAQISIGYLSKMLRGIGNPSIPTARKVSEAMGLTLEAFLERIDSEKRMREEARAKAQADSKRRK